MATPNRVTPSSSSQLRLEPRYDVFLSFRGADTRYNFADVLFHRLINANIHVFRDVEEIAGGDDINPTVIEAINRSDLSIAIISPRYGESAACLMELAHISSRVRKNKHKIIPVFFHTDPDIVKHYPDALVEKLEACKNKLVAKVRMEDFMEWKPALEAVVADLPKYQLLASDEKRYWWGFFSDVVSDVERALGKKERIEVPKNLIGIDAPAKEIMRKLGVDFYDGENGLKGNKLHDEDIRVLEISGLPGVGKSSLAYFVYERIWHLFERCSYLQDIREKCRRDGFMSLQQKLINDLYGERRPELQNSKTGTTILEKAFCQTRVLILLDNLDLDDHIKVEELVQASWFGRGSRIMATARKKNVLSKIKGTDKNVVIGYPYLVKPMKPENAVELLQNYAAPVEHLKDGEEFKILSQGLVEKLGRIPQALEIVGRKLSGQDIGYWRETLGKFTETPVVSVAEAIKRSYDNLDRRTKEIFLDIACFFNGTDSRIATYMWKVLNYFPDAGLRDLCNLCFVDINENKELWMNEELRKFGRNTAQCLTCKRIWEHEKAVSMLRKRKKDGKVEAMALQFEDAEAAECFTGENFKGLSELNFLGLNHAKIEGNFTKHLESLRWLDWRGYPASAENESGEQNLHLSRLVILDLSGSLVDQNWEGWKFTMETAKDLKVLRLTNCANLVASPDFATSTNIERLIMESCGRLRKVLESVGNQQKLVYLSVKCCKKLKTLPELSSMKALEELLIDETSIKKVCFSVGSLQKLKTLSARGCVNLTQLQHIGELTSLTYLALDGSAKIDLNLEGIALLKNLKTLSLRNCKKISVLPSNIGNLTSLETMDLSGTIIDCLPSSVEDLQNLKVLKMQGTYLKEFPTEITNLKCLEEVDFARCESMEGEVTLEIGGLTSLRKLVLSETQISILPDSVSGLRNIKLVDLTGCSELRYLPEFPRGSGVKLRPPLEFRRGSDFIFGENAATNVRFRPRRLKAKQELLSQNKGKKRRREE